ncbi:long-chain acyl-CoA synthetase [Burkholderiaceae bacterium]|nr:long-chain acyl-CoA synthetase [Burkholderiaceae bacterium]
MNQRFDAEGGMTLLLDDGARQWSRAELQQEADALSAQLRSGGGRVLATLLDNTPAWVVADRAAAHAGLVHVPLPLFFSAEQIGHALRSAGVDRLLVPTDWAALWPGAPRQDCVLAGERLVLLQLPAAAVHLPPGTAKISFTSGTTGASKGVCLTAGAMQQVADALVQAMAPLQIRRHLCALPFAVLLENIAGLMAPLSQGATCVVLPLQQLGFKGSSEFDAAKFHAAVVQHRPHSIILLPQMLRAWAGHLMRHGERAPDSLKLVAVGGAAVGIGLLDAARSLGIPAFEGYGLSEGASVQTLNLPGADRAGSAGRPLPHARVRIADDGEIEIAGSLFAGYLGDALAPPAWWPTGDLGSVDSEGFVHVQGRKKNVLITAFGRNVSPEWVETALRSHPAILQAAVFGDGQPALSAVLWPLQPHLGDDQLQAAVDAANAGLPDYARVRRWTRALAPFDPAAGTATANGRPQRAAILRLHAEALGLAPLDHPTIAETP